MEQGGAVLPQRGIDACSTAPVSADTSPMIFIEPAGVTERHTVKSPTDDFVVVRAPGDETTRTLVPGGAGGLLGAPCLLVATVQAMVPGVLELPWLQTWMTIFLSVLTQAMPFLVFGVLLSATIAVFVPAGFFARALPGHPALAVPVAGVAGVVLPGCECASVPVAGALVRRGVTPAAALAFVLASPAVNPAVLISTAVAFPGQPRMVLARAVASLVVACVMGWLWQ